ncbi:MAG: HAD-IIB family hydrolase [Clostridia bacterium]|nr:HAD-IIB family hydrolase [Clostridia bacterium]
MKILASDFDGTIYLYGRKPQVLPIDVAYIENFRAEGNMFGVCTGRSLNGIIEAAPEFLHFDFYIVSSGAVIADKDRNIIYKKTIRHETAESVYESYNKENEIVVQAGNKVYNFSGNYPNQVCIKFLEDINGEDIYGISMRCSDEHKAIEIADEINRNFGNELSAFTNTENVDIVSYGCSKGTAVEFVKEYFKADSIAGIGDSYNDIPMLVSADTGFTFHDSPEKVKAKVDNIVNNVAEAICIFTERK